MTLPRAAGSARLGRMPIEQILAAIDVEIAKLQQARQLLSGSSGAPTPVKKRGRPKGANSASSETLGARRTMSPEARARIGAAQRKRHAAQKNAAKKAFAGEST